MDREMEGEKRRKMEGERKGNLPPLKFRSGYATGDHNHNQLYS